MWNDPTQCIRKEYGHTLSTLLELEVDTLGPLMKGCNPMKETAYE